MAPDAHAAPTISRMLAAVFCLGCLAPASAAESAPPAPSVAAFADFTLPDGAITVFPKGDYVEPYFALTALLAAHGLGLDVAPAASAFAHWLLP
ncbi:MAG: hypothetical protein JWQ61_2267, partial [Collimonas fungivorans]|nr:hypothetical protein [Collimonas fungivorans]